MNHNSKISRALTQPSSIIPYFLAKSKWIPDRIYLKLLYRARTGKKLSLDNPKTFNEKLQWLKLYDRNPIYPQLVDKFNVRNYVAEKIGAEYLIPLIGVYQNFNEIDFNLLPNQFVIKCTHDSGGVVICKDKNKFNKEDAKKKFSRHLKINYFWPKREWPYKDVIPQIICEQYMEDEAGGELKDYKFFCFDGEPQIIQVDFDRFKEHKRNLYTKEWDYIPASIQYPTDSKVKIKKPKKLGVMLELARTLSKGYPHVRVDFYYTNHQIFFGEMTLYHGSGFEKFEPESLEERLGNAISLPI